MKNIAKEIRALTIECIASIGQGHIGGSLSIVDALTVLYYKHMNIDPSNPKKEGRDRLVVSKGHAGPVQYSALAVRGYFPMEDFMTLRKIGSKFQGHPDMNKVAGIEMSTGSLGQGFSVAGGMAMANKLDGNPGRVYVLLGDGEIQEGLIWEAAMSAAHYKLDNLVGILDYNGLQIDGKNEDVITVSPVAEKFESFGWNVLSIDGHNFEEILDAFKKARECKGKPTMIIAKTVKGKGVSFMEDNAGWHGKAPNEDEIKQAVSELGGEL
jgi:transketolase